MRSRTRRFSYDETPAWVGQALVQVAEEAGSGRNDDQLVAFEVAGAVRDGREGASQALAVLLGALAEVGASDIGDGTIVNALTAVQWAAMPVSDVFEAWKPSAEALADVVERALDRDVMLQEQAAQLVRGLVARGLVSEWLGPRGAVLVSRAERLDR